MKVNFNLEKKYLYSFAGVVLLFCGFFIVNALSPGIAPNPGHLISEVAPPAGCMTGQVLQWEGSSWGCVNLPSAATSTIKWLGGKKVHTIDSCVPSGGEIVHDGVTPFCKFKKSSCTGGWLQYKNWAAALPPKYVQTGQWNFPTYFVSFGAVPGYGHCSSRCLSFLDTHFGGGGLYEYSYKNIGWSNWNTKGDNVCKYPSQGWTHTCMAVTTPITEIGCY